MVCVTILILLTEQKTGDCAPKEGGLPPPKKNRLAEMDPLCGDQE